MSTIKNILRALIPNFLFKALQPVYHGFMARVATLYFGNPSQKLFVIGVTGTAGKSTTVMMCAQILNFAGKKTGYITTAGSFDGNETKMNMHGLSMPGGWMLQRQLSEMIRNGCKFAIVECTSEGLAQNRHLGINFQTALFTNLSPAHIDSHGSFENYRAAKGKLFAAVAREGDGARSSIGVNLDDPNKNYFLGFKAAEKFGVSMRSDTPKPDGLTAFVAEDVKVSDHIEFSVNSVMFNLRMFGTFNVTNALLAVATAKMLGVSLETSAEALANIGTVPGRMETIMAPNGATIIVDYAPEPAGMEASLKAVTLLPHEKVIHVFGSTGGHRDVAKRFTFGEISARNADVIVITNDDVYDSDPREIAMNIREGIDSAENKKVQTIETVLDRKEAIAHALKIAGAKDIVLITGKGSEQFLVLPNNERIAWDDRAVVKELLK
ncbi:MAG TPA: UDP-N-acetylmuramoyl-L-alanyl-D-glutamate--2,6-diaminopimelate ligase [Patescibacteria group bacterium]|jgi:UDP-N-acetylmuramoyl-L-alanyl-D-glutamate--2,6-diaminopimelate ligase|nr:UDP-N-acetylmuramoyl-L-alanyl-D-glutamate--2,6-diaminopimelate ligase [Patescibacteria group bacterium]